MSMSGGLAFETLEGKAAFADAALNLSQTARNQLSLMSLELETTIYGTEAFVDRLRSFILQHRRARIRVLINDPRSARNNAPRLIEFGRLLSSRIEFRALKAEHLHLREEYLIADENVLLFRAAPTQLEAKFYADAPMVARQQLKAFDSLWQESPPATELRSLAL